MKMKENLVFSEVFFFYLQKNHLVYECKVGSFILIIKKYQSGSQQAFLIVQIIIV